MLSYLHEFHAGNHADVLKHFVLTLVLDSLNKKQKPFTFFDTHSGAGKYNLNDEKSLKTGEAASGIKRLLAFCDSCKDDEVPFSLKKYIQLVSDCMQQGFYPGSPFIEQQFLLPDSKLILSELHNTENLLLKKNIIGDNIQIHHRNGWEMINALTPPVIKRGAVLIDPSYEELSDYENVVKTFKILNKKWNVGIFCLWYPLLAYKKNIIDEMLDNIVSEAKKSNSNAEILNVTLSVNSEDSHKESSLSEAIGSKTPRLYGSGMLIVNVPWKIQEQLEESLPFIVKCLDVESSGGFDIKKY